MKKDKLNPKHIRNGTGLNQQQFWSRVYVTQSGGSRYESGRSMPRPVVALVALEYLPSAKARRVLAQLRAAA